MAITPLITNSAQLTVLTESIIQLLTKLPLSLQIPATIKVLENSTLLKILSGSVDKASTTQNNILQDGSKPTVTKPILVQLPQLNIPTLRNLNTEIPIVVTILQKSPLLKLQLSILDLVSKTQTQLKQASEKPLPQRNPQKPAISRHPQTQPQPQQPKTILLAELSISPKFKAQLKLLVTQEIPTKQLQQLINLSKAVSNTADTKKLHTPQIINSSINLNPVIKTAAKNTLNPTQVRSATALIWPQHASLEKISQSIIISKLLQLNQQLPTNIKVPFVKVFQGWIKQLSKTITEDKFLQQYINEVKPNPKKQLSSTIKQQAPLWEASVRKQLTQKSTLQNRSQSNAVSNINIKAQLFKIIQSLPVILARISPTSTANIGTPETEVWQMIFKTRELIQQQLQTAIPTTGNLNQPELAINFLEQNLRLLILWLKNVEQQQFEQHRQNNSQQNQQQSQQPSNNPNNNFRFELPMPASTNAEMVQVEIERHKKNKSKQKDKWKWNLKIQFNFGENKKLLTKTHVNNEEVLIQFHGSHHYTNLITSSSMAKLAQSLEDKTGLSCNVEFTLATIHKAPNSNQSLNLKA